jgi:hypothetical protein
LRFLDGLEPEVEVRDRHRGWIIPAKISHGNTPNTLLSIAGIMRCR